MAKNLHRLMLSITESTTKAFIKRPSREKSPVFMPKSQQAETAIRPSLTKRALPISSRLVYFLSIIATISVPPLEALLLKSSAEPTAGSIIAKQSSRRGWSVKGVSMGKNFSISQVSAENIRLL